ncbi:transglutaminase family protein [Roseomonas sp. PWR1]|uniref:Transglutaminase family protein n=1 Tax=Roseomonas nitratireducens TaxID=2820810 RepID=A0ABS4AQ97_9PROT|nr:transglutaminase family protein [Neoroseomonas nitratireducens]MBP0463033.1 transglutaminase family protein [Neoroseomonas nitratireducens]
MSIHVALTHRTTYRYARPASLGPQTVRLRPAPHSRTPVLSYALKIEPKPHFLNWQQDPQGNFLARIVFPERVTHFDVTVDLVADMATINPFDFFLEPEAETWPFAYDPGLEQELAPFRRIDPSGPLLEGLLAEVPRDEQRTVDMLVAINQLVQRRIAYVVRMEPGVWSPDRTLEEGRGSCRDSAWLLVQLLRRLGFAARFVSGYLIQLVADQKPIDGPEGPSADFTDLHAWAEVYLPGAGWIGLDATSGLMTGEGHIPLAATPEPQSAAPISGGLEKVETEFAFEMHVTRIRETPRVTKPYTPAQWQAIRTAGEEVDRKLKALGLRLTMGGEPTFVAASDRDAPEWNIDALGPTKRAYAGRLLRRLMALWSPGAALQLAMGKQYPGEQLPRWALYSHWRADGEPVWKDPALLASDDDRDDATAADAMRFARTLAERLQVDPGLVQGAHEDIHYYLWREQRLPANVVAEDSRLADALERARLAKVFGQGLSAEVGAVLPLRRVMQDGARRWQSGRWFLRGDHLFLIPGDSPVGLRLPLASLPWMSEEDARRVAEHEADPFAWRDDLPPHAALMAQRALRAQMAPESLSQRALMRPRPGEGTTSGIEDFRPQPQELPVVGASDPGVVRTALAVEAREGKIHVFYPPLFGVEDWLDLTAAVEATAAETGRKVVLEGYLPPSDPRLLHFSVTPDPGVIEVNIHPANGWDEVVERTEQLYEAARQEGLAAEKFMTDGCHVGTGGGNHVVMGGATPAESPFLRRPDLLKSLVGFWHNHPSLSYLFSGLFIGPTSQHPRVDEARMDAIHELEIAFSKVRPWQETPPWMTDRLFRNILADMTGNTHRTEFCIDKMYDSGSASGRRGLVEFRAFEMPPHAEMSAAQMLLMRAAVAAFWERPYERRLVRWGTRLNDQFMLPHFCEQDFADAIEELRQLGAPLDPDWFATHFAFRFPLIGEVAVRDVQLELRHALEPWHVLAEENAAGGTARYVDSSAERVQARVQNWVADRHMLAVNGVGVPLSATERAGEFVAGVRFKAWNPPSSLHPTIRPQTPLVLDVFDRWTGRSLGGMTYHVAHPGGRSYDRYPVNANEAEARRRSRVFPFGHTPGRMAPPEPQRGLETPITLDLRRHA